MNKRYKTIFFVYLKGAGGWTGNLPLPLLVTKATLCWVGAFLLHNPLWSVSLTVFWSGSQLFHCLHAVNLHVFRVFWFIDRFLVHINDVFQAGDLWQCSLQKRNEIFSSVFSAVCTVGCLEQVRMAPNYLEFALQELHTGDQVWCSTLVETIGHCLLPQGGIQGDNCHRHGTGHQRRVKVTLNAKTLALAYWKALSWEFPNLEVRQLLIFPHQKCCGTRGLWNKEDSWTGNMSLLRAWLNSEQGS